MKPFSIACTTCQAKLRVRDESVIGQILTCPKCGSMVLVEPTAATSEAADDAGTNVEQAATEESSQTGSSATASSTFEDASALFDEPTAPTPIESPDLTETVDDLSVEAGSQGDDVASPIDEPIDSVEDAAKHDDSDDLAPPPLPPNDEVLLPNADWTSASTVQWRNRALTAIAAVIGVFLAMLLLVIFSSGDDDSPTVVQQAPVQHEESPSDATSPNEVPIDTTAEQPAEVIADESPVEDPAEPEPLIVAEPTVEEPIPPASTDTAPEPAESEPVEPEMEPVPAADPPGLTPKDDPTTVDPTDTDASPLSATLREFGALLDDEAAPMVDEPVIEAEDPLEPDDAADGPPRIVRPEPRVVLIEDRLNDPIAQISFPGVPLSNFLRFVSEYSTIPISLDGDALRWAKVSPNTAVNVDATDVSVAEVLEKTLKPLRLEHRIVGNQLLITRRPQNPSGIRPVTFKVGDLVRDDPEQLQWLADQIMDFVAPDSWSSRGGVGTMTLGSNELVIEQREEVQFGVLEFCEKMRVARGLKIANRAFDAPMFRLETRSERAHDYLATPITLTYLRPARLQSIVDRIVEQADVYILIDWQALAGADWSVEAKSLFTVADQPLAKALTTLLDPLGLGYRVIDGKTIEITTPDAIESHGELEFYRLADTEKADDDLVLLARDALGAENFRDAGGDGALSLDETSNCLIAYLSQPKQLELQAWINSRGGVAARPVARISD